MKPSQLKRWIERHKDEIINEIALKIPLNLEVEIYLGKHLDQRCFFVIPAKHRIILRCKSINDPFKSNWYDIKSLECMNVIHQEIEKYT